MLVHFTLPNTRVPKGVRVVVAVGSVVVATVAPSTSEDGSVEIPAPSMLVCQDGKATCQTPRKQTVSVSLMTDDGIEVQRKEANVWAIERRSPQPYCQVRHIHMSVHMSIHMSIHIS